MCGILSVFRYDEIICKSVDKIKKNLIKEIKEVLKQVTLFMIKI